MEANKQGFWLAITLTFGGLVYLLSPILMPFLVAAALSYLGDPLVDWLESKKIPRTVAVIIVFAVIILLLIAALLILVPAISSQLTVFITRAPLVLEWFNTNAVPWLNEKFNLSMADPGVEIEAWLQEHWQDTSLIVKNLLAGIGQSSIALVAWIGNMVLIPVVTFYLLRDWDKLINYIGDLFPRKYYDMTCQLAKESDEVLGAFARGQLLVMLVLGIIYSVGLWFAGIEVALLVGMMAGIASIVPYLGFVVGILAASIAALIQYHTMGALIPVLVVFMIGQALEGMVLTPLLVGDKIGLHPVTVIFAIMAGGQLFGFVGILIALPLAAVLAVLLRHLHSRYRQSQYYDDSEPSPEITIETRSKTNSETESTVVLETKLDANVDLSSETKPEIESGPEADVKTDKNS